MLPEIAHLFRRRGSFRSVFRHDAVRPIRRARRERLRLQALEDRTLLSYGLAAVLQAYDTGVSAVGTAATTAAVVNQVLGVNALPLADQTLNQALGLAADFLLPFQTQLNQNAPDWSAIAAQLQAAGFSIP